MVPSNYESAAAAFSSLSSPQKSWLPMATVGTP
jgi:hypothetical protein